MENSLFNLLERKGIVYEERIKNGISNKLTISRGINECYLLKQKLTKEKSNFTKEELNDNTWPSLCKFKESSNFHPYGKYFYIIREQSLSKKETLEMIEELMSKGYQLNGKLEIINESTSGSAIIKLQGNKIKGPVKITNISK